MCAKIFNTGARRLISAAVKSHGGMVGAGVPVPEQHGGRIPTPNVYLAKPSSGHTIPALSSSVPGNHVCDFYKIQQTVPPAAAATIVAALYEDDAGSEQQMTAVVYNPWPTAVEDDEYVVVKRDDDGHWVCERSNMAMVIRALTTGAVGTTDATFAIDTVSVIQPPGGVLGTTPTVVNNILGFPAENNAAVIAFYNAATGLWEGIPAPKFWTCL